MSAAERQQAHVDRLIETSTQGFAKSAYAGLVNRSSTGPFGIGQCTR